MQAALEISFYVLGVVFALGLLMVLLLIKDVFFHGRFKTVLPSVRRVPATALDAARATMRELETALNRATGERRDTIAYEMRHLEHRISALEDKTYADQADYYAAVKARERLWREWRSIHGELHTKGVPNRRQLRDRVEELRQEYHKLNTEVDEEYQRAVARDTLTLEELRTQGVLEPEVLRPPKPAPAQATGQAAEGAAPDATAPAAQEAGETPARHKRWMTPLPPYPPAQGGLLAQADLTQPDVPKSGRTYVDATLSMAGLPGGMLSGIDFSRSSFAEVELVGTQHFVHCSFVAADLRRIELRPAETPHMFQDCDFHGASLAQAQLSTVVFRRCNLTRTHWRSARLDRVKFESCNLEQVQWQGVDLSRTVMSDDMLQQADFAFASKPPLNMRPSMESPPELTGQPPAPGAPAEPPASAPAEAGTPADDTPEAPPEQAPEAGAVPPEAPDQPHRDE